MKKRIISMFLVISMALTLLPVQVIAANIGQQKEQSQTQQNPFSDVTENDWYYNDVLYALENKLFDGVSSTKFDPQGLMTRAMYVTVMGRIAEIETADYTQSGFEDVANDHWASPYIAWAKEQGITSGDGNGKFLPDSPVTREQMATFTERFFEAYKIPLPEATVETMPKDMSSVSDFAEDAVVKLWACALFQGDAGNFMPRNNTTRAECATFCARIDKLVENWFIDTGVKEEVTTPTRPTGSNKTYYTYKFDTNGGATVSDRSIAAGKSLDTLPVPYKENGIFVGWCYDEALTDLVEKTDVATGSVILYAKYEETNALIEEEKVPVAVSIDSNKNFSITVISEENLSLDAFRAQITAKNLSSQLNHEWFKITKSGNQFTITGYNYPGGNGAQQAGFVEGSAYKITLLDDGLSFVGQEPTTRVYDFTIAREDVFNVSLDENIKEIPIGDVSNLTANGKPADTVYMPAISVGQDGDQTANGATVGTFTYTKGDLAVGDTVAIYEGDTPPSLNQNTVVTPNDAGFVMITAKQGTKYTYKVAEVEDVLFTPDVLPVSVNADTDGNADDDSMTVPKSAMTYTDDRYALVGLDSRTTIDVGDFVAFYTGEFQVNGTGATLENYVEILTVTIVDDNYVITYQDADMTDIQASMAASKTENIEGDVLLDGQDVEALESSIEQQAKDSGFVEDASMLLASLALETDSFTKLGDDYGLKTIEMQMNGEKITPETLQLMAGGGTGGGSTVSTELSHLDANIATELEHFGNRDGLAVTLELGITITIETGESNIEIDVVGSFTQEMSLDVSVDGDAVWKTVCGFIPYIAEYQVNASVELYTFTGISVDASITSHGKGPGAGEIAIEDISGQIEALLDKADREDAKTDADTLEEKYAAMLETESDWVTLFEQDLMKLSFNVLYVVDIRMSASFVVSANMNLALGASFEYTNAKKYIYSISVFAGNVENDVIDLVPEHYEFEFYVMGTLGLRAGVNLEIAVGVLSCDLGSIGFGAEVGAYVKVWGYFHYKLAVTKPLGKPEQKITNYSGALLFELGVYLELSFKVQILCDSLSYNPTLYENEWPLWQAGYQDNVRDFVSEQEDMPEIFLKKYIKSTQIPDAIFEMEYLDMKEGLDENGELFTAIYDDAEDFKIFSTNEAFSYDPATNKITVDPESDSVIEKGELVIIWRDRALAFSSAPIERRIPLQWDTLRDGYVIAPNTNGGTYIPVIVKMYDEKVVAPENPTRAGYVFAGWFADEALTKSYTFPETMPDVDTNIYAKWNLATDTKYTVKHWGQTLGENGYELLGSEVYVGTTLAEVTPSVHDYTGYVAPAVQETTILADGSRVVNYYYNRTVHTVTFEPGEVRGNSVECRLAYGSTITAPRFAKDGYTFTGWDVAPETHMGVVDLTYTAQWDKIPSEYRVEYYVMQPNGQYELQETRYEMARSDVKIPVSSFVDEQYIVAGETSLRDVTLDGRVYQDYVKIDANGKSVVKVNYDREQYTVTFIPDNGEENVVQTLCSGAEIVPPTFEKVGFVLSGFGEVAATVGTENLVYTAVWTPATGVTYTVKHCRENMYNSCPAVGEFVEIEVKTDGETGGQTNAEAKTYAGFVTPTEVTQQTIAADGSTVVEIHYLREQYTVNWVHEGYENGIIEEDVKYGKEIILPVTPTKAMYTFVCWVDSTTGEELVSGTLMGMEERTFEPTWERTGDIMYYVNHMSTNVGDGPAILETEYLYGTAGELTKAVKKLFSGFTPQAEAVVQAVIEDTSESGGYGAAITINYTRNTYTATWLNEDGSTFAETDALFEGEIVAPENEPTRAGYTFDGWESYDEFMPVDGISIRPTWVANTYEVTFAPDGGSVTPTTMDVKYGEAYDTLPVPTKEQANFNGWHNAAGELVTAATIVTTAADHTLTAIWTTADTMYTIKHWQSKVGDTGYDQVGESITMYGDAGETTAVTSNTYVGFTAKPVTQQTIQADHSTVVNVYYDRNTYDVVWTIGGEDTTQNYEYGATITPPTQTKLGYELGDWMPAVPATMPATAGLTFATDWELKTYTVTFQYEDGEVIDTQQYTIKTISGVTEPSYYEYDGYTYQWEEWSIDATDPQDMVVTLEQTPCEYEVSFALEFPYGTPVREINPPESITVTYGEAYGTLPDMEGIEGYYPSGDWKLEYYDDEITIAATDTVCTAEDHTIFMRMFPDWCNVHCFIPDIDPDRSVFGENNIDYGTWITLPVLDEEGYTHTHWKVRGTDILLSTSNEDDMKYQVLGTDICMDAVMTEHTYTVYFESADGQIVEPIPHLYSEDVELPELTRTGFAFNGWLNEENEVVTSVANTTDITLVADWVANGYTINYVIDTDGVYSQNSNSKSYTGASEDITLTGVTCVYFTFEGWYTDELFENKVEGVAIASGSEGDRTFYAKMTPTEMLLTYDNNIPTNHETKTQKIIYNGGHTFMENSFEYPGYRFKAWNSEPDGSAFGTYKPGDDISNSYLGKTVYAQWEAEQGSIRYYDVDIGAESTDNPTQYTVDDHIILKDPVGIKAPFTFLGWYDNNTGERVTEIELGNTKWFSLTAKWSHPGIFEVDYVGTEDGTSTYKVVRNLPSYTVVSEDTQKVYYRTVNGTAIGGTVEDQAHFLHVGGENAFVEFTKDDARFSEKTFTVTGENAANAYTVSQDETYFATKYTDQDVQRYYDVEVYKVTNSVDQDKAGRVSDTNGSYRREMEQPEENMLPPQFYAKFGGAYSAPRRFDIDANTDQLRYAEVLATWYSIPITSSGTTEWLRYRTYREYFEQTATDIGLFLHFHGCDNSDTLKTQFHFYLDDENESFSMWEYTFSESEFKTDDNGNIIGTETFEESTIQLPLTWDTFRLKFDAVGTGTAILEDVGFDIMVRDNREPKQVGIAPMAYGEYKRGDAITISVVYDEVIGSTENITLGNIKGLELADVTLVGGVGTNILVFTATVNQDEYIVDNAVLTTEKPVKGTVKDLVDQ